MNKYKHAGIILAVATLVAVFACNALFYEFGIHINLTINGFPYYANFILVLLIFVLYLSFRYFHKRLILFVLSTFLLQNSLISGTDDLLFVLSGYDFMSHKESSFVILFPTAIIGMVIWRIVFDVIRNKTQKNEYSLAE